MKVLYVIRHLATGGSMTLVSERIRQLADHDIQISVAALSPSRSHTWPEHQLDEWSERGISIFAIDHVSRKSAIRTLARLRSLALKADIVHVVNSPPLLPAMVTKLSRKPLIFDTITTNAPRAFDRALRWTADVNLAVSHAVDAAYGVPRTRVIYPPVNLPCSPGPLDHVDIGANRSGTRAPKILMVTRLTKLSAGLISFAQSVFDLVPTATILVAGDGPNRAQLTSEAQALGMRENFQLLGFRNDIQELHSGADVYVSLSAAEGLVGYATLEAAVLGTPIVATDIPAVSEVLRNNVDAILVPPGDSQGAALAASRILESPVLAGQFRHSASARVHEMLDPKVAAENLMDLYRSLAG